MVNKIDVRKNLQERPRTLPWPKFSVTRMLTRDLFAVANFLVLNMLQPAGLAYNGLLYVLCPRSVAPRI